jgi:hypothetical protein
VEALDRGHRSSLSAPTCTTFLKLNMPLGCWERV